MEGTPGLDIDIPHTPSGAMQFPPSAAPSSSGLHASNPQATEQTNAGTGASQPSSSGHKFSNGPHIRSRITVVCAECKRLKLKCVRRTPCSSCLKRDTVQRCVYSQAAAEKVDVQTLHNRIIEIERILSQLQAASPSTSVSSALAGLSTFKQPAVPVAGPSRIGPTNIASTSNLLAGLPCNDRALLAQGASGSSVVINLEDVISLWLNELEDLGLDSKTRASGPDMSSSTRPSASTAIVKLEPAPVSIPPAPSASFSPGNGSHIPVGEFSTLHPPAPYDTFLPPPSAGPSSLPQVTAALVSYLPSDPARSRYLKAFRETMLLHPSFNVPHFEQRIAAIFTWAENGENAHSAAPAYGKPPMSKQDLARDIFFSTAKPGSASRTMTVPGGGPPNPGVNSNTPMPTLSFFSAACSAFALGSLVFRDEDTSHPASPSPSPPGSIGETSGTSAVLFALSEQALQLFEKTAAYDLDCVIAMILQVLYMLHEGGMSVAQSVFPLVGKMVNVARMMGLAMDPDEFPGTYNLFEAETRRRVWWEVYYYDLFIADAMGHPPLIADNTHTTHLPADVEEDRFTPSCTSLPLPESAEGDSSSVYFGLKCRLAQLVKNVKKQTFRDPLNAHDEASAELSIDHAGTFEGEVSSFLQELPEGFKLEATQDVSKPIPSLPGSTSPVRMAQKCELAILANRLVIKLYLPFLKEAAATNKPSHPAVFGTINAAHNIIYASRMLHSVWGQTRPAVFDFYDFGRTLFDAAVVCAHTVIQEPMSIVASEAMKNVSCALDILQELGSSRLGVEGTRANSRASSRSEAVKIIELMKRKAEAARSGGSTAGTKRKHSEVEGEMLASSSSASFQLPFVGAAVSSSKTERARAPAAQRAATTPANGKDDAKGKPDAKKQAKEKDKKEDKDKSSRYLNGPLRMRPMTGQPGPRRQRTTSVSTAATSTPAPSAPPTAAISSTRAPPATPSPPSANMLPSSISSQVQPSSSRASMSIPESSMAASVQGYSVLSSTQDQSMQQREQPPDDYVMQYSSPDDSVSDDRRYSAAHSSYDSPQSVATAYDPQPQTQYVQSPVSAYPPTPSQPQNGYYLSYTPQPPPGPPTNGYEGHPAMMGMMPPPPPPPPQADTSGTGGIAPAMTTITHTYVPPRQIEYQSPQPQPNHQHQHPHLHHQQATMQGWPQQSSPANTEMWTKYEFGVNPGWAT